MLPEMLVAMVMVSVTAAASAVGQPEVIPSEEKRSYCRLSRNPSVSDLYEFIHCRRNMMGYISRSGRWGREEDEDTLERNTRSGCTPPQSSYFSDYLAYVSCRQGQYGYISMAGRSGRRKRGCGVPDQSSPASVLNYVQCMKGNFAFVQNSGRWGRSVSKRSCQLDTSNGEQGLIDYLRCMRGSYGHVDNSGRWGRSADKRANCILPSNPSKEQFRDYFTCMKSYSHVTLSGRWGKRFDCPKPKDDSQKSMTEFLNCLQSKYGGHIMSSGRWGRSVDKRACSLAPNANDEQRDEFVKCLRKVYGHVVSSGRWGRSVKNPGDKCVLPKDASGPELLEYMRCIRGGRFVSNSGRWGRSVRMRRSAEDHVAECRRLTGTENDGDYTSLLRCLRSKMGYVTRSGRWG